MLRRCATTVLACVLLLGGTSRRADARVILAFEWATCTWDATHIVVAAESSASKHTFTVSESWVGPSLVGSELHLPPKKGCASLKRRPGLDFPVTGKRVVLFLIRDERTETWRAYADWRCWIEGGQAYSYAPEHGPEGRPLGPLGMSEVELRTRVLGLRADMTTLAALRANADFTQRTEGAKRLLGSHIELVAEDAIRVLGTCGKGGVAPLLGLLDGDYEWKALRALAAIGDTSAVPPLVERLERQIAFWTEAKKRLVGGTWKDAPREEQWVYERHMNDTDMLVDVLASMPSRVYEDPVRRMLSVWRSPPEIRDVWHGIVENPCLKALHALKSLPATAK